jgi:amicoumacin kinase
VETLPYDRGTFLDELCRSFELTVQPKLIRSNTNLIYDCGDSILRLTPNSFRSADEVARELHWMEFVGSRTTGVVHIIGDDPVSTRQFSVGEESFTAARLERIDGKPVEQEQWNASHFEQLGQLTGLLHRIGQDYSPPENVALVEWDKIPEACLARQLPDDDRCLPRLNKAALEYMGAMPCATARYGPIHYDIHAGNYLLTPDGRLILFDFENSCRGHYINDIAVVLYYARLHRFTDDDADFAGTFLESYWTGYKTEYPVPHDEAHSIPWLLMNRGLMVYGYLRKIWPNELDDEQAAFANRVEDGIASDREELGI